MTGDRRRWGRGAWIELGVVAVLGLLSVALTWPLAWLGNHSISAREDYFQNLWNFWWVRKAFLEPGASIYWTDWLFFPDGVSLLRHTLSPANSLPGALLGAWVGYDAAYSVLLLGQFWLAGWACYLLARELTGSRSAAFLAGIFYAFCPYHYYYLAQINVASTGWLPLAVLFLLRSYRHGGWRAPAAAGACSLLVAASHWYYWVCLVMFGGMLLLLGRLWDPRTRWRTGARRLCVAGLIAGLAAAPLAWPLLTERADIAETSTVVREGRAYGNDLLGAKWVEPRPHRVVSWPTMLGYTGLALVLVGIGRVRQQPFWLAVILLSWLVSLGSPIRVGGAPTPVPSPLVWLYEIPGLAMFRNPDRAFILVQLAFSLMCAFAWTGIREHLRDRRLAGGIWAIAAVAAAVELSPAPLASAHVECPEWLKVVADDEGSDALIDLPPFGRAAYLNAYYQRCQMIHGKKIALGYVTSLARTKQLDREGRDWDMAYDLLLGGKPAPFAGRVLRTGIDWVVLHKRMPAFMPEQMTPGPVVWRPFRLVRQLARARQLGIVERRPLPPRHLAAALAGLERSFGPPVHEDASIVVFRAGRATSAVPPGP